MTGRPRNFFFVLIGMYALALYGIDGIERVAVLMTFPYLYIVRVTFFHTAMFFIPHFITRSNCSSSFAIMGGSERGVLGALFVTFSHFGSV